MVRFSCFNTHIHRHKPKKSMEGFSEGVIREDGSKSKGLSSIIFRRNNASVSGNSKPAGSTAVERVWKSEEIILEHGIETHQVRHLKKSQSLGDELYFDGRDAKENGTDGITSPNSLEQSGTLAAGSSKRVQGSLNLYEKASVSVYQGSDQAHYGSIFSVGDRHHADEDSRHLDDTSLSGDQMDNSNSKTPNDAPLIVRSNSMPNIADSASEKSSPSKYSSHHSRSSDAEAKQDQERNYDMHKSGDNDKENLEDDGYDDAYDYPSLAKDWIVPPKDELKLTQYLEGETSNQQAEFPGKDFKIKRIEDWVSDLQHVNLSEEADEITGYQDDELPSEHVVLNEPPTTASAKVDVVKLTPGMEAAKKYISSLSASATTAQLVNHGLVVIPFLSAFVSLRVLNLSGNAIVRITAGALPRGLHALNLSKNSISVIEGLRELTRLRVLDLSYNKILRLGHGLASCSSLKELYLAGNKISEIEGLHRLLKLTVLDLRFNKFSTTKSLGLLAANYSSVQAISLEGNPAQKNVGDEQLRKYLLGLLPHLVYYNRQGAKDARLGPSTHQLDRGLRSEIKNSSRKSSHGASSTHKPGSSAARKSSGLPKRSKERSSRLPPVGHKVSPAAYENYYVATGDRLSSLRSELSMRRSRSEGTLGPV
uniref:Leucine-rich repeat-containing protein 48 n=1 Tax=Noccaea caerulescens TaxID=107243 RepID=A0A1J3FYF3_NOCCA